MFRLEKVEIKNLWGWRDLDLSLDEVTLLVGANGSGKTTVIKLISLALDIDVVGLNNIEFDKINLIFGSPTDRKKPRMEIERRTEVSKSSNDEIYKEGFLVFACFDRASAKKPKVVSRFSMDEIRELSDMHSRHAAARQRRNYRGVKPYGFAVSSKAKNFLSELMNVSWLSTSRTVARPSEGDYGITGANIDSVVFGLQDLLSRNQTKENEILAEFQKNLVLGSLSISLDWSNRDIFSSDKIEETRVIIGEALDRLQLDDGGRNEEIINEEMMVSLRKMQDPSSNASFNFDEVVKIGQYLRIHRISSDWLRTDDKIAAIHKNWVNFKIEINDLLTAKEIDSAGSRIFFKLKRKRNSSILEPKDLSSGERHLLVLLGETLIKNSAATEDNVGLILISDEPELSLHLAWQAGIIDKIRKITPNGQILMATHSPEVLGNYRENCIDLGG